MLNKIFKKVSGVFMAVSIFSLIGCSEIDQQQAADVEKLLQEKYDQEFTATHIGGRYGTAGNDTVTTYLHPADNKNAVFSAVTDKDGGLLSDSYIPRQISDQFNQMLKEDLASKGIESETFTFIMNNETPSSSEANPEISLGDYVTAYKPEYFSGHMIVKESPDVSPEQFESALRAVYETGLKTDYQVGIRVIAADEYEKAAAEFKGLPEVSSSWFLDYNVVEEIDAVVDANGFNYAEAGTAGEGE